MRFPPANGFAGSAVWQLVQSPASTSALPCAMVSSEGSAFAGPAASALHKMRGARIARIAGVHPIDGQEGYSAQGGRYAISSPRLRTTQTEIGRRYRRHEVAICENGMLIPRFCDARPRKTDIEW